MPQKNNFSHAKMESFKDGPRWWFKYYKALDNVLPHKLFSDLCWARRSMQKIVYSNGVWILSKCCFMLSASVISIWNVYSLIVVELKCWYEYSHHSRIIGMWGSWRRSSRTQANLCWISCTLWTTNPIICSPMLTKSISYCVYAKRES